MSAGNPDQKVYVNVVSFFLIFFSSFVRFLPFFFAFFIFLRFSLILLGQGQNNATYWKNGELNSNPVQNFPILEGPIQASRNRDRNFLDSPFSILTCFCLFHGIWGVKRPLCNLPLRVSLLFGDFPLLRLVRRQESLPFWRFPLLFWVAFLAFLAVFLTFAKTTLLQNHPFVSSRKDLGAIIPCRNSYGPIPWCF